jgi:hypothetical protein
MIKIDTKVRLTTLWIVVLINMIFADIFSIMVELVNGNSLYIPGNVRVIMAIAAVVTNIPIMMIYLSRVLKYKLNRIANIVAAILTIIYVIGGGDTAPHYLIIATIEVLLLITIIIYSLKWKNIENE